MESVLRVEESLRREGLVKRVGFKPRVASPQGNTRWQCRQLSITFAKETCTSFRSSHCFRVKCETDLSSWYTSSCGVPQGSFLGTLLFIMYTSPLRTLISSCSLKHQLNADDIQLFLSFLLTQFNSSTDHLHNAVDRISSWQIFLHRTPLRLNFCSLISVNNLPKSTTPHLTPLSLLKASASYPMNTYPFLTRSHLSPNLAITIFVSLLYPSIPLLPYLSACCIRPYLDTKTVFTIATSTVHYCNSLYHNLPKSQITRLQQIQNSLASAVDKASKST